VIRVAIVDTLGGHGGMNYYTHELGTAMTHGGLLVTVQAPADPLHLKQCYRSRERFNGVYGTDGKIVRGIRLLRASFAAAAYNWRSKTDWVVFHIFRADAGELLSIGLAKATGRRVACIIHDISRTDRTVTKNHMYRIVALTDLLVVHNEYSRDLLCRAVPAAKSKVVVIGHGAFVGQFAQPSMAEARALLGLPAESTVLLFFGHQRPEKGLNLLIQALKPFAGRKDLILQVAGKAKPNEEAIYRQAAEEAGVASLIRFDFGHVPDSHVPAYFRSATTVMLPYKRIYESGVALMAMSFGRAVIVSDIPVFAALADECAGVVTFVSEDPVDLSKRISELLNGSLDSQAMGNDSLNFVRDQRSWEKSGISWSNLLNDAI
jgi:D-inositol-3-phosphate glycosyltransferase